MNWLPRRLKLLIFLALAAPAPLPAANAEAEQVLVVFNRDLPESRQVAEHYAARRGVPASRLLGLPLPKGEIMTRAEYEEQLRRPVLNHLAGQKLWTYPDPGAPQGLPVAAQIRYAVLCYGVPLKIKAAPELKEPGADKLPAGLRRNEAAVDAELACLPGSVTNYLLSGPLANPWHATTNAALLHPTNGLLLVARLDGPTAEVALGLVDKALAAETNGLWGRAYFDLRNTTDTNYLAGDRWLATAAAMAWRMGYLTEADTNETTFAAGFPLSQVALYAGWYDHHVSGPFARPTVEFMPGAFAYHLHSFSASSLRTTNQFWAGPLLARGVTATIGFVEEPYLQGTLDLPAFLAAFLGRGATFAEAAYTAQANLSWQTTVIGDPLYRPVNRRPEELHAELVKRASPLVEWSHAKVVILNLATGLPASEAVRYLENESTTRSSAVLTEMLADFYWQAKKLLDSVDTTETALKRKPSPQQKARLLRKLADRLEFLQRHPQRLQSLQTLVREFPDHPDLPAIQKQITELQKRIQEGK